MVRTLREIVPFPRTPPQSTVSEPADLHSDEIDRLRDQLWIGLMVATIVVLVLTSAARVIMRDPTPPSSLIILGTLVSLAIANIYYLKTPRAHLFQGIYVVCIHLAVPPVLVLYGGTRGFGDVALLIAVILTPLYGWRRWMFLTFAVMAVTLVWVLYRDIIGDPVAPLLNYSAQFTALKFFIMTLIMIFILRYTAAFYRGLLDKYRVYAEAQVFMNREQARLNRELQTSRQNLVTAREEERRRLRRDLHDGLGPTLAAQVFRIGAAQQWITKDTEKATKILDDLQTGIEGTLTTIRQLVYELRPPMLDQLGLVGAITDFINRLESPVEIKLDLPAQLPPLSAAVEVAAFRIMQTSLDNVIKHAQASHAELRLTISGDSLSIDVTDDGKGIADEYRAGVGLTSMRERAEELGGRFAIAPIQPKGTQLLVTIPLLPVDAWTP